MLSKALEPFIPLLCAPIIACTISNILRITINWIREPPRGNDQDLKELKEWYEERNYIDEDLMKYFNYKE